MRSRQLFALICLVPAVTVITAFFLIPAVQLLIIGASGEAGMSRYLAVLTTPRYREALISTVVLSLAVTAVTLVIGGL
ncbi:MAG: ABC transporter permease, partial [Bosea sp. (in: a-proteobacteria)]